MALSSNSLIHFTKNSESLKGILNEGFKVKYCLENLVTSEGNLNYSIPMVSFCDIPLSSIKDHIIKYGGYGIGLTQEWGKAQKMNPVLYIDNNSSLAAGFYKAYMSMFTARKISEITENEGNLANVVRYMKNYEGELNRAENVTANYRFADEKEWRFVPDPKDAQLFVKGALLTPAIKTKMNDKVSKLRLTFQPKDIKYIIVNDETEISEFIEVLRKSKAKHSLEDIERLITRIITTEQILTDF